MEPLNLILASFLGCTAAIGIAVVAWGTHLMLTASPTNRQLTTEMIAAGNARPDRGAQ